MSSNSIGVIDIGGTKIAYALVGSSQSILPQCLMQRQIPFKKGIASLKLALKQIIKDITTWAQQYDRSESLELIVGSAGNFKPNSAIILPGTAVNLGNTPTEFDGLDLKKIILDASNSQLNCQIVNDALLQLAGGLLYAYDAGLSLAHKTIAYIGPGTGLGGAFARLTPSGLEPITDGHIFDMKLHNHLGQPVMAEDVFSGRGFQKSYHISLKEINDSEALLIQFESQIQQLGDYLAQIMINIYQGHFKKYSDYPWKPSDYESIKHLDTFILGGSIATKGVIAKTIKDRATSLFQDQLGITPKLFSIPDTTKAALMGGFALANSSAIFTQIDL
tara:strand:- start:1026 stop:2024 length:999 start_codon:yes stop_codon:yes gene_type:complete